MFKRWQQRSLRQQLVAVIVFNSAIAILVTSIAMVMSDLSRSHERLQKEVLSLAQLLGNRSSAALAFQDEQTADENLQALASLPQIASACLFSQRGKTLAVYARGAREANHCQLRDKLDQQYLVDTESGVLIQIPIRDADRVIGAIQIQSTELPFGARFSAQLGSLSLVLIGALSLALVVAMRLQRVISKPLADIRKVANAVVDTGDYSLRTPVHGAEDLRVLELSFNHMLQTIETLHADLRHQHSQLEVLVDERTAELGEALKVAVQANASKSVFLANISHEVRTPMNAIIGMTELVLRTDLEEKQRKYLEKVDDAAHGLLGIINDILDFSKMEAGKIEFTQVSFSLNQVLERLVVLTSHRAQNKGLEFLIDVEPEIPVALIGDDMRLCQVLVNLVSNAIKFTHRGEVLLRICRAPDVNLNAEGESEGDAIKLLFEVRDTGIGITPEQREKLFNAFTQADASTSRQFGGTGLGLIIARGLVHGMQGEVWLTSTAGVGTSFFFTAVFGKQGVQPQFETAALASLKALRVLVVDDNLSCLSVIANILQSFRLEAQLVTNGRDCLDEIKAAKERGKSYDLVFLDWYMPDMDGLQTLKQIRENADSLGAPRVIMISAYYQDDLLEQTKDLQLSGFVEKPINASALFDAVTGVVGAERKELQSVNRHAKSYQTLSANLRGARVLLVDDNEVNRSLGLDILTQAGLIVDLANDGAQAVEKVAQNAYDAVLMDWQMPVMDGFEATRQIRADARFAKLPILAMTANAMSGDKEKCLAVGMDDHIAKPINVKDLLTCLTRWIVKPQTKGGKSRENGLGEPSEMDEESNLSGLLGHVSPAFAVWSGIKELKVREALQRLDGNEALYQKLLDALSQEVDAVPQIRLWLAHGETQRALIASHSLKGLAANLGATELMRAAQAVEKLLQAAPVSVSSDLERCLETLANHLDQLLLVVAALPDASKPDQSVAKFALAWDTKNLFPLLRELQLLIQACDASANICATKLTQLLNGHHAATAFEAISGLIRRYDFDQARMALQAFIVDQHWEREMAELAESQAQLDQFSGELRSKESS